MSGMKPSRKPKTDSSQDFKRVLRYLWDERRWCWRSRKSYGAYKEAKLGAVQDALEHKAYWQRPL